MSLKLKCVLCCDALACHEKLEILLDAWSGFVGPNSEEARALAPGWTIPGNGSILCPYHTLKRCGMCGHNLELAWGPERLGRCGYVDSEGPCPCPREHKKPAEERDASLPRLRDALER